MCQAEVSQACHSTAKEPNKRSDPSVSLRIMMIFFAISSSLSQFYLNLIKDMLTLIFLILAKQFVRLARFVISVGFTGRYSCVSSAYKSNKIFGLCLMWPSESIYSENKIAPSINPRRSQGVRGDMVTNRHKRFTMSDKNQPLQSQIYQLSAATSQSKLCGQLCQKYVSPSVQGWNIHQSQPFLKKHLSLLAYSQYCDAV